jgi:hypothetical protein
MQAQQAKEKGTFKIGCAEEGEMRSGVNLSIGLDKLPQKEMAGRAAGEEQTGRRQADRNCDSQAIERTSIGREVPESSLPDHLRAAAVAKHGEYDARRLRSQREVIRDVMLAAADCDTWLTLSELRALTRYGEASISAQLRHLRKLENGGYDVSKQRREDAVGAGASADGRGECVWEYRILRILQPGLHLPA